MSLISRGRTPTFHLETPREILHCPGLPFLSSVPQADRDLLRSGYWVQEGATGDAGPEGLMLIADEDFGANIGPFRCLFADPDSNDALFSESAVVITGTDWRARTKIYDPDSAIIAGSYLTVQDGADATGTYGHLKLAVAADTVVAQCRYVASDWLYFTALAPFKMP